MKPTAEMTEVELDAFLREQRNQLTNQELALLRAVGIDLNLEVDTHGKIL